jgi:hypothetical protein
LDGIFLMYISKCIKASPPPLVSQIRFGIDYLIFYIESLPLSNQPFIQSLSTEQLQHIDLVTIVFVHLLQMILQLVGLEPLRIFLLSMTLAFFYGTNLQALRWMHSIDMAQ